jgi:hypothetical protein
VGRGSLIRGEGQQPGTVTPGHGHYVRGVTFPEDAQQVRAGNQPSAYAALRNLVTGAFRHAGFPTIAHARRYYGRDDQRIPALYGCT